MSYKLHIYIKMLLIILSIKCLKNIEIIKIFNVSKHKNRVGSIVKIQNSCLL